MAMVDKLRNYAHFVPIKSTCKAIDIANIFMKEIFRLHGIKFTSSFWKSLMVGFKTKLLFSIAYHPQTDGKSRAKTKRVNQILEYMLRMNVMHQPKKWGDYLPLLEFSYNNNYQESFKMSPFEALYGRQ
jgi:hypothetical protein